jgi:death-on-curing protein
MTTLTISLPEDLLHQLNERAAQLRVAPEALVRASIEALLTRPAEEFQRAMSYVLNKNRELYWRLASCAISYSMKCWKRMSASCSSLAGEPGVLNVGALESALAQPRMTFGGQDLYPTMVEKAAALGFSLIQNHPFVEQEDMILQVAAGKSGREVFTEWLRQHLQAMP